MSAQDKSPTNNRIKFISKIVIAVIIVVLYFVISSLSPKQNDEGSMPTSYDNKSIGSKAFYLLLQKMGYNISRFEFAARKLPDMEFKGLVLIVPYSDCFKKEDAENVYEWAASGNSVLIADAAQNELYNLISVYMNPDVPEENKNPQLEFGKTPAIKNVSELNIWSPERFVIPEDKLSDFEIHIKDKYGVICASTTVGKGRIIILSAPELLVNMNINEKDNAIFAANLISMLGSDLIAFNEAIHGIFKEAYEQFELSSLEEALIYQLIAALLVFFFVYSVRFGKPRLKPEETVRMSAEYIHSLAALFKNARARKFAIDNLIRGLKRRISKLYGITAEIPDERLVEVLDMSSTGINKGKISHVLEKARNAARTGAGDREITRLAGDIEKMAIEIQHYSKPE